MYANRQPFTRPTKAEVKGPKKSKKTSKVQFKPEAIDADGDGIVQEGTPFERPVEAEIQAIMVDED